VHLDDLSRLLRDDIVQLACEVFGWKAKVRSQDHVSQDVFSVVAFDPVLILSRQMFVNSSWFIKHNFKYVVMDFKQLPSELVDLHDYCLSDLLGFVTCEHLHLLSYWLQTSQTLYCCIMDHLNSSLLRRVNGLGLTFFHWWALFNA
jgi:hypothetical protein